VGEKQRWEGMKRDEAVGGNEVLGKLDVTNLMVSSGSYINL
jgi:hypothetical protein